jgi:hypothetical protein
MLLLLLEDGTCIRLCCNVNACTDNDADHLHTHRLYRNARTSNRAVDVRQTLLPMILRVIYNNSNDTKNELFYFLIQCLCFLHAIVESLEFGTPSFRVGYRILQRMSSSRMESIGWWKILYVDVI